MNISNEYPIMIFRNEYDGNVYYKTSLSKKDINGNYINGYIQCKFKKGVEIENKTNIYIKKAFLSFYNKNDATIPYIFISEFETIDEVIEKTQTKSVETIKQDEIIIDENELPF